MKNLSYSLTINLGLLFSGFLSVFSGLLIQVEYHIGKHGISKHVLGIDYQGWSLIHKYSVVILFLLAIFHIYLHWKWYRTVIRKKLFSKNKEVLGLSIIFLLVAITGFLPWIMFLVDGSQDVRNTFIEVHDKLAIILIVYFIMHLAKRLKWFLKVF